VTLREFEGVLLDIRPVTTYEQNACLPAILVPPLVNAHTHLEFSELAAPIEPARPFPEWIRSVIQFRQQRGHNGDVCLAKGLNECSAGGVGLVADIATSDSLPEDSAVECIRFREAIGLSPERIQQQSAAAQSFLQQHRGSHRTGLSPHAPYTVHPDLMDQLMSMAEQFHVPVAMHLAETTEELELLQSGNGRLADFLRSLNLFDSRTFPGCRSVREFLEQLSRAPRALAVHGNYFSNDDLRFLQEHSQITTVYCPRTHAWFGHTRHPVGRMLQMDLNVVLGTDSRASNPDLSIWKELQHLAIYQPRIPTGDLLTMITTSAATALGHPQRSQPLATGTRLSGTLIAATSDLPFRSLIGHHETQPVLRIP
jgi:cytosine/adenosine deaminase-related metal-dependent hydrolase